MASKYAKFVHEYTTASGETRYAVAEYVERAAQYQWPLPWSMRPLTYGFARKPQCSPYKYTRRDQAIRAARRLYWTDE